MQSRIARAGQSFGDDPLKYDAEWEGSDRGLARTNFVLGFALEFGVAKVGGKRYVNAQAVMKRKGGKRGFGKRRHLRR